MPHTHDTAPEPTPVQPPAPTMGLPTEQRLDEAQAHTVQSLTALRALYGPVGERALRKALTHLDPHCQAFIAKAPFVVLASQGADGRQDASPRGGAPGFVQVLDAHTLLIGDAPGNNRLDSLDNILATGQLGLLFMIPGVDETLRVNGNAVLSLAAADIDRCHDGKRAPKLVIRLTVAEAYLHCAKAFMRSRLWQAEAQLPREALPTMGQMIRDQTGLAVADESQAAMVQRYQADL